MRILTKTTFLGAVLVLAARAPAQSRAFNLTLLGANEPNSSGQLGQGDPDGVATGFVTLDPGSDMVTWDFNYQNITGDSIIGFPLSSTAVPNGRETGMLMTSDIPDLGSRIDAVLANPSNFYINLHSSGAGGFPGGAVRATLPEPGALGLLAVAGLGMLRRRGRAPVFTRRACP